MAETRNKVVEVDGANRNRMEEDLNEKMIKSRKIFVLTYIRFEFRRILNTTF